MPGIYEHIKFQRETNFTERRPKKGFGGISFQGNPKDHAQKLQNNINQLKVNLQDEISGYDERFLLKLNVADNFSPDTFASIEGVQVVSQENKEVVILFTTENALSEFERRLSTYASNENVTRKEIIEATRSFELWSAEDRIGDVLKREGLPLIETFILDIELWNLENNQERNKMLDAFETFLKQDEILILDKVNNSYITILRVKCTKINYQRLLKHRDIRTIDLPPKFSLEYSLLQTDISDLPNPLPPKKDAPAIAVLDSGINANHPLLKGGIIGDARSYIDTNDVSDHTKHGTSVSGIALYGEIEESIRSKSFIANFYLLSGKILDENNEYDEKFIENQIDKAVREFHTEYGCKIFNLSIGDQRRPYAGGKVSSLTLTLDNLSHELGILFVISAGNLSNQEIEDKIEKGQSYPKYLLEDSNILEPANSINSLTVGSIAKYDKSRTAANNQNDPAYQPMAPRDSISPFSRIGFGIGGSIKPDLVAYGGNLNIDHRSRSLNKNGLGVISLNSKFLEGNLFTEDIGTSYSAPYITHLAGRVSSYSKDFSSTLIKALLVASAETNSVKIDESIQKEDSFRLRGYGKVDEEFLFKSSEEVVILYATDFIQNDKNHFYEIPIPEDFFLGNKRKREVTVTISYNSSVRNTRVNYRASRISFRLLRKNSMEEVVKMFNKATSKADYENIPEYKQNRTISSKLRDKGTVQSSTWELKQPRNSDYNYYLVVTRNDFSWGEKISKIEEEYSLVIVIKDIEAKEAKLYSQIKEKITIREKVKL
jgi:hypothetical protein